jgi:hypothetical protein
MPTINSWNSNVPVEISKGGTNANTMSTTDGVCYFDGTSIVTTAVGTATHVLTSNGVGNAPTFQVIPGVEIQSVTRQITSQEIKALHGTPITLISAPGANRIITITNAYAKFVYGGTNVFVAGAAQYVNLYYGVTTTSAITSASQIMSNSTIVGTVSKFSEVGPNLLNNQVVGVVDNVPIVLYNQNATEISGNAANDNYIMIEVFYVVSDTLVP